MNYQVNLQICVVKKKGCFQQFAWKTLDFSFSCLYLAEMIIVIYIF